jgi:hypothetical protein
MSSHLERHESTLGVPPGATMDEINNAYYFALEQLGQRLTEEQEARLQQLKHSYAVLSRAHEARGTKHAPPAAPAHDPRLTMASFGRKRKSRRKAWISLCAVAALVLGVGTVTRMTSFKLRMKQYEPGTVVRFEKREKPYGTVLRFEPAHRFHTGIPAAAYRLRLADGDEEIWLAERVVEQAMVPVAVDGEATRSQ